MSLVSPSYPLLSSPFDSLSPSTDNSSIIDDLSFEYVKDDMGDFIRTSKGSNHSSPPTPPPIPLQDVQSPPSENGKRRPSSTYLQPAFTEPALLSPVQRVSLSRSESAFPVMNGPPTASSEREKERARQTATQGSLQRVTSAPLTAVPPIMRASYSTSNVPLRRNGPRRVTTEEHQDAIKKSKEELRVRMGTSEVHNIPHDSSEDKENDYRVSVNEVPTVLEMYGSPSAGSAAVTINGSKQLRYSASVSARQADTSVSVAQIPSSSAARHRSTQSASSKYGFGRISEVEDDSDGDIYDLGRIQQYLPPDTDIEDDASPHTHNMPNKSNLGPHSHDNASHRKMGSSEGAASTLEQSANGRQRRSASLSDALTADEQPYYSDRESMHVQRQHQQSRPGTSLGFRGGATTSRKDADDKERVAARSDYKGQHESDRRSNPVQVVTRQSPSPPNAYSSRSIARSSSQNSHRRRDSDTLRSSTPYLNTGSPTVVEPPAVPSRLSPSGRGVHTSSSLMNAKHRRSPTAPEPSTTSNAARPTRNISDRHSGSDYPVVSSNDPDGHAMPNRERDKSKSTHQKQLDAAQDGSATVSGEKIINRSTIVVNKKSYVRLDLIGKGGSSRVYRVMTPASELYAIKRVTLDNTDRETMNGYTNEINLLRRLDGNSRIIRLIDSEVRAGPGGSKGYLFLVMECGEIDLAKLLNERAGVGVDMIWIAYYWQQMLQAVQVIHDEKIVHSDLKPANFVLVKGQLKLIDFGIANAIANDTTNIQRDHQIGTVNYMSPEAIEIQDGNRRLKVGRPSDVWSLGCILYQMVYGSPPFQSLPIMQKMRAIPDPHHNIDFPEYSAPSVSKASKQPETKLSDHVKWKVRPEVIANMKSCLQRNPKDRMTIPELLNQNWLAMKESSTLPTPSIKDLLKPNETVIDPYFMNQLLVYGINLGRSGNFDASIQGQALEKALEKEALRLVMELKAIDKP